MSTYTWSIPSGKEITGSTYLKDTDNYLGDTINDLVDFVNGEGLHENQGMTYDFVDKASDQTITGKKTYMQDIVGNIDTATQLKTPRTITLSNGATGTATFDGSGNINISVTLVASQVLSATKTVDGIGSGLDAEYIGGISYLNATGVNVGTNSVDPDITSDEYILTNHVNTPNPSYHWHIRTQFYSTKTSSSNRAQIAIKYNSQGSASVYTRSSYNNVWSLWEKLVSATDAQALHETDALRISGNTLYLYKGNGGNESVSLPNYSQPTSTGEIGTYAFLAHATSGATITAGGLYSGSDLRYAGIEEAAINAGSANSWLTGSGTPSGTWRAMGTASGSYNYAATLFLRVS